MSKENREFKELQDLLVHKALKEKQVPKELRESKESKEFREFREFRELQVLLVSQDHRVQLDQREVV